MFRAVFEDTIALALREETDCAGTFPRYVYETHNGSGIYHGHQRKWEELTQEMQNALVKAGVVNRKGKRI